MRKSNDKKVLILNNDEKESKLLREMLERAGYRATTTWSGIEALDLLKKDAFDMLLVSDYLPDIYFGDFFKRFNTLPDQPCSIVVQGECKPINLRRVQTTLSATK